MGTFLTILVIAGVILLVLLIMVVSGYNGLVGLRNRFRNAFSQIDVQLKRRHDLIPNLVETAKGYMKHERETLEAVIQARNQAASARQAAQGPDDTASLQVLAGAETALTGTLSRFLALQENYPDLKADTTIQNLMEELTSTENRVAFARQAYNDAVMNYNTKRESFPTNLIAGIFKFKTADSFEIEDHSERAAPEVSLSE